MKKARLQSHAKSLRHQSTDAEKHLWYTLRDRRLLRYKFRRQYVIDCYIVDFVCLHRKLIVELDGGQHAEQKSYDDARSLHLQELGYRVMRFWNNEVLGQTEVVLEEILRGLGAF